MAAYKVAEIKQDAPNLKTYVFRASLRSAPGQFVMVWMPGVDEVPMSIGWQTDEEFHVGIANAGDCTDAIDKQIKVGDKLGIRGPYGTVFDYADYDRIVVIGGGYGTPPLLNLAQRTTAEKKETIAILGARSADYLIYEDKFASLGATVQVATDDGTKGHKGYCTAVLEGLLEELAKKKDGKKTCVYTCGPEVMMHKVAQMCEKAGVDCQVSLERYMKCGFGICGQCCMDDSGMRVCKDGPVIKSDVALDHPEFGRYSRSASGAIMNEQEPTP